MLQSRWMLACELTDGYLTVQLTVQEKSLLFSGGARGAGVGVHVVQGCPALHAGVHVVQGCTS